MDVGGDRRNADRVAAARANQNRQAATDAESRVLHEREGQIDQLVEEAESLIPAALATLATNDYEGIREVTLSRDRFAPLGDLLHKTDRVGAYVVCEYHHPPSYGLREGTSEFLLLSNGRLMPGNASKDTTYSVAEFADKVREHEGVAHHIKPDHDLEPFSTARFQDFVSGLRRLAGVDRIP